MFHHTIYKRGMAQYSSSPWCDQSPKLLEQPQQLAGKKQCLLWGGGGGCSACFGGGGVELMLLDRSASCLRMPACSHRLNMHICI